MTETAFGALLIILAGGVARHFRVIRREDGPVLVRIVIYLALPPLIFLIIAAGRPARALLLVPVAASLIHVILLGLVWVSMRVWGMEPPARGALHPRDGRRQHRLLRAAADRGLGRGFSLPAAVMYDRSPPALITWTSTVAIATSYGRAPGAPRPSLGAARARAAAAAELGASPRADGQPGRVDDLPRLSSARSSCWARRRCPSRCSTPGS